MIMKSCSMQSLKDKYLGMSTHLKEFELLQVMLSICTGHAVRVFVQGFKS